MFFLNYLFALVIFVVTYLAERLILFWFKKKDIWPLVDFNLLIDSIVYSVFTLLLLGIIHLVFKKVNTINLLWLDAFVYIVIHVIKPSNIVNIIKSKEKFAIKRNHILGASLFIVMLLECFVFNANAYSDHKETFKYQNFISEGITSNGEVQENKIVLKNKQYIEITTNQKGYDNIYLHFIDVDI